MAEKIAGNFNISDDSSGFAELVYQVNAILMRVNTCVPVQVTAVRAGGLGPVGFVDIQVMVTQLTGDNTVVSNPSISNVPYFRLQGGRNAVIIDPEVGDIGIGCFCQRDISSVKKIRGIAPPGSYRTFSFSDAVYIGGMLNGTPIQFIKFDNSGIQVYSPTSILCEAPQITLKASSGITLDTPIVNATKDFVAANNVSDMGGTKSMAGMRATYDSHTHPETQSTTGTPNEKM